MPALRTVVKLHDTLCTRCGMEFDFPERVIAPESWERPVRAP